MATQRIGLTGGIGSGKSTVASLLVQQGAQLVDADAISRACTAPLGAAMPAIAAAFGPGYVAADGSLERGAMRTLVFNDPRARGQLEAIVHPLVVDEIARQTEQAERMGSACIVVDIPLLVESGRWRAAMHRVLVVDCRTATQIERVCQRSGMEPSAVAQIVANQASRAQRLAAADAVLYNDGIGLAQLSALVHEIGQQFGL